MVVLGTDWRVWSINGVWDRVGDEAAKAGGPGGGVGSFAEVTETP